jgi:phosphoenolpyruvate carboxylase
MIRSHDSRAAALAAGCRIDDEGELAEILHLVYQSLWDAGSGMIADGHLLDILRRLHIFGLSLLKMDLRQESTRHTDLLAALTKELEVGDYAAWDEARKCAWLVRRRLSGSVALAGLQSCCVR